MAHRRGLEAGERGLRTIGSGEGEYGDPSRAEGVIRASKSLRPFLAGRSLSREERGEQGP